MFLLLALAVALTLFALFVATRVNPAQARQPCRNHAKQVYPGILKRAQ